MIGDVVDRKVDLKNPDIEIFVEVRNDDCYIYTEKISGPGGLPIGTAGTILCLLSGGIDSAVAAWMMMKRGCKIVFFHAKMSDNENMAVRKIVKKLQEWHIGYEIKVYTYDHAEILKTFNENFYRHTCILCKRMIYRAGNIIAKKLKIKAMVTGEALGQVASQTLDNLTVLDQASDILIFRPLIGMDKIDIIKIAENLGTFQISSDHKENCWAWPTKPKTKSKIEDVLEFEKEIDKEIKKSLGSIQV